MGSRQLQIGEGLRSMQQCRVEYMGDCDIDPTPGNGNANIQSSGGQQGRQEWVRANFRSEKGCAQGNSAEWSTWETVTSTQPRETATPTFRAVADNKAARNGFAPTPHT